MLFFTACDQDTASEQQVQKKVPQEIYTSLDKPIDQEWLSKLKADLKTKKFAVEKTDTETAMSQISDKRELIISGKAIRHFYIKRQEAEPENYYPDFSLYIFELKSEQEAKEFLEKWIETSRNSALEKISVETSARNGSRVFFLETRAEMFRPYIDHFKKKLES